jgi:hypothetical protein
MKVQAQNVDAPDAVALAMRNAMLFHIDEAIAALPKDEEEVRSALPAKSRATLERVRRRWGERDLRSAGISIMEQTQGLDGLLRAPAGGDAHPAETKREKTPRALTADALVSLQGKGVDIRSPASVAALHKLAEEKSGIKVSKATLERALQAARRSPPSCPSSSLTKGTEGTVGT